MTNSYFSTIPISSTYLQNGFSFDINGVETSLGKGTYIPPIVNFEVVPDTRTTNYVCETQNVTANVPMTLNAANSTSVNGVRNVLLDCARGLQATITTAVGFDIVFTVTGTTINGVATQSTFTIGAGTTTGYTDNTYLRVSSIVPNVDANGITVGNSVVIGLPFYLNNLSAVNSFFWGTGNTADYAAFITDPFGAAGRVTAGNAWRTNSTVSLATTDQNGYVNLPEESNGVKRLRISYYAYGADASLNALIANEISGNFPYALPVTTPSFTAVPLSKSGIKIAKLLRNTSNTAYVYPTILAQDLIGPSFPTDSEFMAGYAAAAAL